MKQLFIFREALGDRIGEVEIHFSSLFEADSEDRHIDSRGGPHYSI
jgi:hypothetical protein